MNPRTHEFSKFAALDEAVSAIPSDLQSPEAMPFFKTLARVLDEGRVSVRYDVRLLDLADVEDLEDLFTAHGIPAPFDL